VKLAGLLNVATVGLDLLLRFVGDVCGLVSVPATDAEVKAKEGSKSGSSIDFLRCFELPLYEPEEVTVAVDEADREDLKGGLEGSRAELLFCSDAFELDCPILPTMLSLGQA